MLNSKLKFAASGHKHLADVHATSAEIPRCKAQESAYPYSYKAMLSYDFPFTESGEWPIAKDLLKECSG
jgi:hypothetical protein